MFLTVLGRPLQSFDDALMAEEVAADSGGSVDRCFHADGTLVGCEGGSTILGGSVGSLSSNGVSTLLSQCGSDRGVAVEACQVDRFNGRA